MATELQMPLVSSAEMADEIFFVAESSRRRCYTGDRLRARQPELYARILQLLMEGEYRMTIAELCGVDHRTVAAVAARHPEAVPVAKRRVALRFLEACELGLDLAQHLAAAGDARGAKDAMIAAGIADDHWQLLAGEPTSRVELDVNVGGEHEWFNSWIRSGAGKLEAKEAAIEVEVDVTEPHVTGPLAVAEAVPTGASDSESCGGCCAADGCAGQDAGCVPQPPGTAPTNGGEGVGSDAGGGAAGAEALAEKKFYAKGGSS